MRSRFAVLFLVFLPTSVIPAQIDLPEWVEASESGSYFLGGGLWPNGLLPEGEDETELEKRPASLTEAGATEGGETEAETSPRFYGPAGHESDEPITADSITRVASEEIEGPPFLAPENAAEGTEIALAVAVESDAPAVEALPPIEGALEDLYFAHAPVDFLVDPQRLLTEQKSNDIKRFLEFHSDESEFHIYVMVIGESQRIPENIDLEALHKEWFSDNPTVLMVYSRETPEATEFVYNASIESSLPSSVFGRIRQNCLREGAATDLAPDQVEKMAIELSIQLYWLSRLKEHETQEERERVAATPALELPASADAPEHLREYAPGIFLEKKGREMISIVLTTLLILATIAGVGLVAWFVMWWQSRDRVSGKPLLFPSFQSVPRLGGEFCGGGFVSMSFELNEPSDFS